MFGFFSFFVFLSFFNVFFVSCYVKQFLGGLHPFEILFRIWSHLLKKSLMENIFCAVAETIFNSKNELHHCNC